MSLLLVIIALALLFDYINGFHDAANSIATVVSTKVLSPFQAVLWAALWNFAAYFIFKDHAVANTISKVVHQEFITLPVILSGLVAAIIWNLLTWWYGIPSSSSHTLIGGFAGAALTHAFTNYDGLGFGEVVETTKILIIVAFIFLAPVLGMLVSIFFSFVNMVENTWFRVTLMVLTAVLTWALFVNAQEGKMHRNLEAAMGVPALHEKALLDPAYQAEYEAAAERFGEASAYISMYELKGAEGVAAAIQREVDPNLDMEKATEAIRRGDNSIIRYGIMLLFAIFIGAYIYVEKIRVPSAFSMARMFKKLQLVSSAAFSLGHGGNDAQKVMGIIAAALIANGNIQDFKDMPNWVPLACYTMISLGTLSGGWKIIKTMGTRITKVSSLEGVNAETGGALTLYLTEQMGIPVSTTHTITGAIMGVGATKRLSAVRWGVTFRLLWAWIITIPVSAAMAALAYWACLLAGL